MHGAREVYFIEEPLAAAIGSGIHIEEPTGNMIIDFGGGTTEASIISLGGIVVCKSLRIAGDQFDEDIIEYIKKHDNLSIGVMVAEEIKKCIGPAYKPSVINTMEVKGRDLETGLPRNIEINSCQVLDAMQNSLNKIVNMVTEILEKTPPELAADLLDKGIVLSGEGALLKNLDKLLSSVTNMPVYITDKPEDAVIRGIGKSLLEIEKMKYKRKTNKLQYKNSKMEI